jgi:hypothetical protein
MKNKKYNFKLFLQMIKNINVDKTNLNDCKYLLKNSEFQYFIKQFNNKDYNIIYGEEKEFYEYLSLNFNRKSDVIYPKIFHIFYKSHSITYWIALYKLCPEFVKYYIDIYDAFEIKKDYYDLYVDKIKELMKQHDINDKYYTFILYNKFSKNKNIFNKDIIKEIYKYYVTKFDYKKIEKNIKNDNLKVYYDHLGYTFSRNGDFIAPPMKIELRI